MDINQLEVFVTTARERSFSRAADVLGRTQPAVSQAVRRLEEDLGEVLFDRSSKDGTLTYAGQVLLEHAEAMLHLREHAANAMRELKGLKRGKVTVSANEHTVFFLLPVIARFAAEHPDIRIDVQRGVASRIPLQITSREVELGVISFTPDDDSLVSVPVLTDELVLIVAPGHRLAKRDKVTMADLTEERFIAHNAPSPYRRRVIESFAKAKAALNIEIELPSLEAIKLLVMKDVGVALVPRLTAEAEIAAGSLAAISVNELKLARKLNIIHRRNSPLSHAAEAFLAAATARN